MKVFIFTMLATVGLVFTSCENNLNEVQVPENNFKDPINSRSGDIESIKFIYHGKTYESTYTMTEDSVCLYHNSEVNKLAQQFDHTPGLVSFYYPNKDLEYFDNDGEFQTAFARIRNKVDSIYQTQNIANYGIRSNDIPILDQPVDALNHDAELWLYDDIGLLDRREDLYLNRGELVFEWPHLKRTYGMNDKTSSFVALSIGGWTIFELYEDDHYKSHCMKFMLTSTQDLTITGPYSDIHSGRTVASALAIDLHECDVVGTKRSTWNDRITSVRITRMYNSDFLSTK